ncbi:MAG: hypothetical protein BGO38_18005 [Cellulomonas sp. 73-145]|uniref:FMN-binding protein n=1 Tax=Cellulomonas sp. 73-145 TaxID=1895739 RepID=UPI000925E6FB|nr:FMN-binding protein [Cellulomonas sp. 73-145]OJV59158.1 MAG: hypothetical protein BGO38_18005 [Cellulomonas sp. 73-145]
MTPPSRGSALYAATLVTIGAAAGVRFFTTTPDLHAAAAQGAATGAPVAAAVATPSSTPTATGSSLSWGRGPHPSATPSPTPSRTATVPTQRPSPTATPTATPTRTTAPAPAPKPAAPAPPPPAPVTTVVVGSTVQTRYGPVQVQVTFTGTAITAAQALQAPSGGYSSQVSSFSIPVLSSEAVAAGSANIAAVSGASYTSAGYQQSLQYAIDHRG